MRRRKASSSGGLPMRCSAAARDVERQVRDVVVALLRAVEETGEGIGARGQLIAAEGEPGGASARDLGFGLGEPAEVIGEHARPVAGFGGARLEVLAFGGGDDLGGDARAVGVAAGILVGLGGGDLRIEACGAGARCGALRQLVAGVQHRFGRAARRRRRASGRRRRRDRRWRRRRGRTSRRARASRPAACRSRPCAGRAAPPTARRAAGSRRSCPGGRAARRRSTRRARRRCWRRPAPPWAACWRRTRARPRRDAAESHTPASICSPPRQTRS